jgi:hypothetical protein
MSRPHEDFAPSIEFGIASTCLGSIGLMLFFLPILSIPIAICGFLAGVGGVIRGQYGGTLGLRWSLIGCVFCVSVVAIGFIVAYAPIGEIPSRAVPPQSWAPSGRPFISPPADSST